MLDRIATLGVATDYDLIGLKPDQREIESPPVTHLVTVVEEQVGDTAPPMLKTVTAWFCPLFHVCHSIFFNMHMNYLITVLLRLSSRGLA